MLPTPEHARAQAKASDKRLAAGKARPLEGLPLGNKDLFCTQGIRTTACSNILDDFKPTYESTVGQNLWDAGAVMLGKLNNDEFAMGSSNETSAFGNVVSPWRRKDKDGKVSTDKLVPGGSSGGSSAPLRPTFAWRDRDRHGRLDPPARRAHRHRRHQADLRPLLALGHRRLCLVARSGRADRQDGARCGDHAEVDGEPRSEGHDLRRRAGAGLRGGLGKGVKGLRVGVPKEYRVDGMSQEIEKLWHKGIEWLKAAGAEIVDISLPHTKYALPAYYIVAPAECSSNLARYDGMRYGLRVQRRGSDRHCTRRPAPQGFGKEVRRRILIGTYVLSAGYYDAYYLKAQKVRTLIKRDFDEAWNKVDVVLTPTTPSPAFAFGEKTGDPLAMYLEDIFTVTVNMAGLPGMRCRRAVVARARRSGCSSSASRSTKRRCSVLRR